MRILFTVHHALDLNAGAAGVTLQLARALEEQGHAVDVYSYDDLPDWPILAKKLAFPFFVTMRFRRASRAGVDVVDASTGDACVWTRRRRHRPALVTRSHGLEHTAHEKRLSAAARGDQELNRRYRLYTGGLHLWQVKRSLRSADACLFLNGDDLRYATSRLGVREDRAHITRNGLPDALIGLPILRPVNKQIGIAQIATYLDSKGIGYSAPVYSRILGDVPGVRLKLLGTALPREAVIRDFPTQLHSRIDVVPRFERIDLPDLVRDCQIKVLPSLSEGFGLSVLEAMACGLAPVVTDTSGPRTFIEPGVNGLVVPVADAASLEAAIRSVIAEPDELERLRRAAHATAQTFSWRSIAAETADLYRTL